MIDRATGALFEGLSDLATGADEERLKFGEFRHVEGSRIGFE